MIKYLVYISLGFLLILQVTACKKFAGDSLNDNELLGRLQSKGGKWKILRYEKWNNTEVNPNVVTTEATEEFFHFYTLSSEVSGALIDISTVDHYKQKNLFLTAPVQAQLERVVFEGNIGEGIVWTVEENKRTKQTWNYVQGEFVTRITLERCDCEFPDALGESAG